MAWLRSNEFLVGSLCEVRETSLVLGQSTRAVNFLVGVSEKSKIAVGLGKRANFQSFDCSQGGAYSGIIIPNPTFEVEIDPADDEHDYPVGSLLRQSDKLLIVSRGDRFRGSSGEAVELQSGLASGASTAAFIRWRVVVESDFGRVVVYSSMSHELET